MLPQENQLHTQEKSSKRTTFEEKIQPILNYIGIIGASIMSVAYIIIVVVMIVGFKVHQNSTTIVFAIVNALVGLLITQFLKVQGVSFAKSLPENQELIKEYYHKETKDKKYRSIKSYWFKSVIKDVFFKGCTVAFSTIAIIYIVIVGSEDYNLLLMAITNLLMFICFGLLALNASYEFYNNMHVPYMQHMLEESEKEVKE